MTVINTLKYLLTISNVLVTSICSLRSACRGMVQLWITCLSQMSSEFTCHISGTKCSSWPPPPAEFSSSVVLEAPSALPGSGCTPGCPRQSRPLRKARPPAASAARCRQSLSGSSLREGSRSRENVLFWVFLMEDGDEHRGEGYRRCLWRRQPASSRGCLDLDTCWRRAETQSCSLWTHSGFVCPCICSMLGSKMLILPAKWCFGWPPQF